MRARRICCPYNCGTGRSVVERITDNGKLFGPDVGFEEIAIDVLQPRLWIVFRFADQPPRISHLLLLRRASQAIIAPTHGSDLWHETWPLRNRIASRRGRHGRSLPRERH